MGLNARLYAHNERVKLTETLLLEMQFKCKFVKVFKNCIYKLLSALGHYIPGALSWVLKKVCLDHLFAVFAEYIIRNYSNF